MPRFFHSLVFKISATILILETLALTFLGAYYVRRFGNEIDDRIEAKVRIPGVLVRQRALNYDAVRDAEAMQRLVGEDVIDSLIIQRNRQIFYAANPDHEGQDAEAVLDSEVVRELTLDMAESGIRRSAQKGNAFLTIVTPLHSQGNLIGYLYLKVDTSHSEHQKTVIARLFALGSIACILLTTLSEVFLVHTLTVPRIRETVQCLRTVEAGNLQARVSHADSADEIGELERSVNAMITEIERRTSELRHLRNLLSNIINSMPSMLVGVDPEGRITHWNDEAERATRVKATEAQGRMLADVFPQVAGEMETIRQTIRERNPRKRAKILMKNQDETRVSEIMVYPLTTNGVEGAVIRIDDVTERVRAEERIRDQNILLEQAVQEKQQEMEALFERLLQQEKLATIGQMAGSIAHELRNPLGAVKNSVFFLKRLSCKHKLDASNPKVEEHLSLIENELDISERVISDLLYMTRMKPIQKEQTDLHPIIAEAAERCRLPERIHLALDVSPEPFLIWADPLQLRQVLMNLLTNAAQAIEREGSITIRAKQVSTGGSTVIEVQDTGAGIEAEALDKIFEPLYTTKATGTGLGLSICKQIIENHNGSINLISEKGQGTTMTIVLPDRE